MSGEHNEAISFGGGINSTAMIIMLANDGWRGPVVFSDTGCEWTDTYCFMDQFEVEWLMPRGMGIERIEIESEYRGPSTRMALIEYCEDRVIFPTRAARWCTDKWKVRPLRRWAKENGNPEVLLGIASDESHRQKGRECPLVDRGITRQGCVEIIQAEKLPVPRKSGCYMCWAQRIPDWRELHNRYPELYDRVALLDRRVRDERGIVLELAGKGLALDVLRDEKLSGEIEMFGDDLRAYQPCSCGL